MKKHTKMKIRNLDIRSLRERLNYLKSKHKGFDESKLSNQMRYISFRLKKLEGQKESRAIPREG